MSKMAIFWGGGWGIRYIAEKLSDNLFSFFFAKIKHIPVTNTSPGLIGLESLVQILRLFEIFLIMGPYGGKNFKCL